MKEDLKSMHKRGMRFMESRRAMLPDDRQQTAEWSELAKLGRDTHAKTLRDQLAAQYATTRHDYLQAVRFAAAVEIIVNNCGPDTRKLLLDGEYPQKAKGILSLSRTSDTRQRYRVDGVRAGRFRSVAPQNDDAVFDTVTFNEVPSRLGRSRGKYRRLPARLKSGVKQTELDESRRLAELCHKSAVVLRDLVRMAPQDAVVIPTELQKDVMVSAMKDSQVRTVVTGFASQMLRLTIKSVWDFPEMKSRGIYPTEVERQKTIQETEAIIAISDEVLQR